MQPSPATSSQGKSSMLGEVLGRQNHKFSAAFRDFYILLSAGFHARFLIRSVNCVEHQGFFLPLTLSNKVKRGHSAVFPLSLCKVLPHGAL